MELIKKSIDIKEFLGENPLMAASIRTTKKCNAFCKHCYGSSGDAFENELETQEIKRIIDLFSDNFHMKKMFFTGGEPFTRKDIVELIQYAHFKDMEIMISTNGKLITKELLMDISHVNFSMFQVSLDGEQKVHDKIRGEGFFDYAISAIELLKDFNFKNTTIATCLMRDNFDQISKIVDIVVKYEVDIYALVLLLVTGKAEKDLDVTSKELKYAIDDLFRSYRKYNGKFKLAENCIIPPALVPTDLRDINLHKQFELCCAFPNIVGIEANGNIAPCDGFFTFPEYIAGNIRENNLKNIWNNSPVFKKLENLDLTDLKGVCSKCIFLKTCAGSCRASSYSYYDDITAPFPTCQKLFEDGLFPEDCLSNRR